MNNTPYHKTSIKLKYGIYIFLFITENQVIKKKRPTKKERWSYSVLSKPATGQGMLCLLGGRAVFPLLLVRTWLSSWVEQYFKAEYAIRQKYVCSSRSSFSLNISHSVYSKKTSKVQTWMVLVWSRTSEVCSQLSALQNYLILQSMEPLYPRMHLECYSKPGLIHCSLWSEP